MYAPAIDHERRKWQNPEAILADIGLKPGFTFIDVGCGGGFFALPAARIVGRTGKVFAIDSHAPSTNNLKELASGEGLRNLDLTVGKAEELVVCEQCADIIFFGIVLHDFQDPARVLKNARRMVKPTGKLINLDWKKESMNLGPPLKIRFSEKVAVRLILKAGFTVDTVKNSGDYHYLVVARP
ncbi:MAG: hypothetical protein A2144_02340 [Chloroflexi bacterium RBG_16_50_9]|nr:MAG: hypothetical protein A2144_02340 [Chloroflexi bacterium RBG_16_50_9]